MLKIYISLHWRKMLSSPCLELSTMPRILNLAAIRLTAISFTVCLVVLHSPIWQNIV